MTTIAQDYEPSIADWIVQSHMPVCFKQSYHKPPSHEAGGGSCVGYPSTFDLELLWPYSKRMSPAPWKRYFGIDTANCNIVLLTMIIVMTIYLFK